MRLVITEHDTGHLQRLAKAPRTIATAELARDCDPAPGALVDGAPGFTWLYTVEEDLLDELPEVAVEDERDWWRPREEERSRARAVGPGGGVGGPWRDADGRRHD